MCVICWYFEHEQEKNTKKQAFEMMKSLIQVWDLQFCEKIEEKCIFERAF